MSCLKFTKLDLAAILPTRAHPTDAGYDLWAIGRAEIKDDVCEGIVILRTGLQVCAPAGYYVEIHGRSSLTTKWGWCVANSIGIIDSDYRGELLIALRQISPHARPIESFPFKCCQLIPRRRVDMAVEEVAGLEDTARGSGGFGSTDTPTAN